MPHKDGSKSGGRVKGSKDRVNRKAVDVYLRALNPTKAATGMTTEEIKQARRSIKEVIEDSFFDMQQDVKYNLRALAQYDLVAYYNFIGKIVPREVLGNIQHDQTINIVIEKNYENAFKLESSSTDEIIFEDVENPQLMNDQDANEQPEEPGN